MRTSLITEYKPYIIHGNVWFKIRELTEEDVFWSEWHISEKYPPNERIYSHGVSAETLMNILPEVLIFPEEILPALHPFKCRFFDPKRSFVHVACFLIPISFVGIRKQVQYLIYNNAVDVITSQVLNSGNEQKAKALKEFNEKLASFVKHLNEQYLDEFVRTMSQISAYDLAKLDEYAGTTELVKEIEVLSKDIETHEKTLHTLRVQALRKNWQEDDPKYPQEAVNALRERLDSNQVKQDTVHIKWKSIGS